MHEAKQGLRNLVPQRERVDSDLELRSSVIRLRVVRGGRTDKTLELFGEIAAEGGAVIV